MIITLLIWFAVFLIPAWFLQLIIHECSHAVSAVLQGYKVTGVYPYPHKIDGHLYFARCAVEGLPYPAKPENIFFAAPLLGATLPILFIPGAIPFTANVLPVMGALLAMWVMAAGDVIWWMRGYWWGSNTCDGKRFRYGDVV